MQTYQKNKSNEMQKSHMYKQKKWTYYIEERRREVAQMLAKDTQKQR